MLQKHYFVCRTSGGNGTMEFNYASGGTHLWIGNNSNLHMVILYMKSWIEKQDCEIRKIS
jgi:hypothetical protein